VTEEKAAHLWGVGRWVVEDPKGESGGKLLFTNMRKVGIGIGHPRDRRHNGAPWTKSRSGLL